MLQARSGKIPAPQEAQHAAATHSAAVSVAAPMSNSTSAAAQAAASQAAAAEEADEDEPQTMPLLARRVMAGRQSIIPGHSKVPDM